MESKGCVSSSQDGPVHRWSLSSSSHLPYGSFANSLSSLTQEAVEKPAISPRRAYIAVGVLCFVNMINYMERYTLAGTLINIQTYFGISNSKAGLLQTVFICSFVLLAPLFGYLGDRYKRTYIMTGGLTVWIVTAAASSFVTESYFWLLILLRSLVGIGEASYSTIAPTIISDLFTGGQRSTMICAFYIFIPVGRFCGAPKFNAALKPERQYASLALGLGYITGAGMASLTGDWRWALRITPLLGLVGLVLLFFLCPNPPRGAAETHGEGVVVQSTWLEDIKYLLKIKSYVWSSLGVTATAFSIGAMAFWVPTFLSKARIFQGLQLPCIKEPCNLTDSFSFGASTVVTGIIAGFLGTGLSRWLRDKVPHVDPLICAAGLLGSAPFLTASYFVTSRSIPGTYVLIVIGELLLSMNWAVMADILLYIVIPTRRSTAEALQITISHLLGDAVSPYIIGLISDAIYKSKPPGTPGWDFHSLQYSFLLCSFVEVMGGLSFLMSALYITKEKMAVQQWIEETGDRRPQQDPVSEPSMELNNQEM